ncbi:MAG: glycosyltransferase family 39 protein [Caldilineales bacterium]|nr:glycosyltransferase family 39 protein [Caldilineales bacterium]
MPSISRGSQLDSALSQLPQPLWRLALPVLVYALSLIVYVLAGDGAMGRLLWLAGMALAAWAYFDRSVRPSLSKADGWDVIILAGILLVAFVTRFWRLGELPDFVHGDVASQGLQAIDILQGGGENWFGVGWAEIPMLDYLLMAGTMQLFGSDLFGLSMTAVWQGLFTVAGTYLLGREMFNRRVGLLAAAILTISYTHIHYSRVVITGAPLVFVVFTLYFLFRGLRLRQSFWAVLGGMNLAFSIMVYSAGRVIGIILIALFVLRLMQNRRQIWQELGTWFAFGVGALAGFGPTLILVFQNLDTFVGRANTVTLANPEVVKHLMSKYGVDSAVQVWLENAKRTFLTFTQYGDTSGHFTFPGPIVDTLTAVLMVAGFFISLFRLLIPTYFTLIIWFLAALFLGGVITNDPPFWSHIAIVLPCTALFAAIALDEVASFAQSRVPMKQGKRVNQAIIATLALLLLVTGVRNWQAYRGHVEDNADPVIKIARYVAALPSDTAVIVDNEALDLQRREVEFFAQNLAISGANVESIRGSLATEITVPTDFVLAADHADLLAELQERFPAGVTKKIQSKRALFAHAFELRPDAYTPPPDRYAPAQSLRLRSIAGWLVGLIALALLFAAGIWIVRRHPHTLPSPSIEVGAVSGAEPGQPAPSPSERVTPAVPAQAPAAPELFDRSRLLIALGGALVALLLAYLAQSLFDADQLNALTRSLTNLLSMEWTERSRLNLGAVLYLLSMITFAATALPLPTWEPSLARLKTKAAPVIKPYTASPNRPDARTIRHDRLPRPALAAPQSLAEPAAIDSVRWVILLIALVPYFLAMILFAAQGETALVRWLWAASLAILFGGLAVWPWLRHQRGINASLSPPFDRRAWLVLGVILAAGFLLRYVNLAGIPSDFHGDMASQGLQAREILEGKNPFLFREGWANIPMMAFVPASLSLRIFGNNLFGLNMTSVIGGLLSILALYLLAWRLFDSHRIAALAAAILAINTPHIHFSRIAAYMDPWPFLLLGAFLLVDGLRARRSASLTAAGVLVGLGMQMYYSGRVSAIFLTIAFIYLLLFHRRLITDNWAGIALFVVAGIMTFGPSLIYFAGNFEAFAERSRAVFLFHPPVMEHLSGKYGVSTKTAVILEQTRRSTLMFNQSIDSSTQFGYPHPMFSSILSPLVALGFGYGLRWWRRPHIAITMIWLFSIFLFGSVLTGDAPFWPRLIGILPAAALLAAIVIDRFWENVRQLSPSQRAADILMLAIAGLLLVYVGWQNWSEYARTVENNARPQARIGRYLASLPEQIAACSLSDPYQIMIRETLFLAQPRQFVDLPPDATDELLTTCPGPDFVWVLGPNSGNRITDLQRIWPQGVVEEHYDQNGALAFITYLVNDAEIVAPPQPQASPTPASGAQPATSPAPSGVAPFMPDGSPFAPQAEFFGTTASTVYEIDAGRVRVEGGRIKLLVGPVPGYDAVFDYVELRDKSGASYRFEAESTENTSGDEFAENSGLDGHWWQQNYDRFSAGQGLVTQKGESVPVLTTEIIVADGEYDVVIGSFTGDPNNGIFALAIRWE